MWGMDARPDYVRDMRRQGGVNSTRLSYGLTTIDVRNAPCDIHGVAMKECGCPAIMADRAWCDKRSNRRMEALGRICARQREKAFWDSFTAALDDTVME
jgi:hypothetical protein